MIDRLRAAADALNQGDPEPFASLFADDAEWRGVSRGFLWWRNAPSCRGPDQARAALKSQIENRGLGQFEMPAKFMHVGDDRLIGSTHRVDADGVRASRSIVLTIQDGKIADMQVCGSMREAQRFARRVRS